MLLGHETVREPEFSTADLALLRAHLRNRKVPSHGIDRKIATDPANQFKFAVEGPFVDWAAHALGVHQDAYYKQYPDKNRAGDMWRVRLKD